jgi:tetratricopeptide (TPR) repeat protein
VEVKGIMQNLPQKLKFSTPESFQLVMTGLRYLRAYQHKAEPDTLNRATEALATGVRKFPNDIAPRFYLGVTKAVSGAKNSHEAVSLFEDLLKRINEQNTRDLCLAVKYNLASAYAETHEEEGFTRARELLAQVFKETRGATTSSDVALRRQAEILSIWLDIRKVRDPRLAIQNKRKKNAPPDPLEVSKFKEDVNAIRRRLEKFKEEFDREGVPEHERNEVLADYWNNMGIVDWYLAEAEESERERIEYGHQAIKSFQESLQFKLDWPHPRSNIATVYHDILNDPEHAEEVWLSILQTEPTHAWAMLNLGDLAAENAAEQKRPDKARARWEEAVEWYRKSASLAGTLKQADVLLQNLHQPDEARAVLDALLDRLDPAKPDEAKYRSQAYETLGRVQERLGNKSEAIAAYEKSDQPKAREALVRIEGSISEQEGISE